MKIISSNILVDVLGHKPHPPLVKTKQLGFRCPTELAEQIAALANGSEFGSASDALIYLLERGLRERRQLPESLLERVKKIAGFLGREESLVVQQSVEGMCDLIEGTRNIPTLLLEYAVKQQIETGDTSQLEALCGLAGSAEPLTAASSEKLAVAARSLSALSERRKQRATAAPQSTLAEA
jgi:hypothetical protein